MKPVVSTPTTNTSGMQRRLLHDSQLHRNPFAVLGVTTRDDRRRIVELAEERSLELDHDICQKSRSDLTSPIPRLAAEIAWLPGVSPRKALELMSQLRDDPMAIRNASGLPTLAHLNLLAAAFESIDDSDTSGYVAEFILELACLLAELSAEQVLRDINEDRAVSGFPEIKGVDQVSDELFEQRRYYRNAIKDALNRLSPAVLVTVMTEVVNRGTCGGNEHAPELIDDLVDSYSVETQEFLQKEGENIKRLINSARDAAGSGEKFVVPILDKLELVARNWDKVAQPIQLSAQARGIDHEPSQEIAYSIRGLVFDLFKEHDYLDQSSRLTQLLKELFAEVPEILDRVEGDAKALAEISQMRDESSAIDPIRKFCEEISKSVERKASYAQQEGLRLLDQGKALLNAAPIKVTSPTYLEARDLLAATLLHCAVAYGNETSKWEPCIRLLRAALELANDQKLIERLRENLRIVEGNYKSLGDLDPVKSAPSLYTLNGCGVTLYGNTDANPFDGSHMATYYLVILFVPVLPLARYRVIPTAGGYRFLGKGPLRSIDKLHIAISLGLIAWMVLKG